MQVKENIALAPYTTFRIGGLARYFATVQTTEDLKSALSFAREKTLPVFILGGGSNVLISDEGFSGLVIKVEFGGITVVKKEEENMLVAGAGEAWDEVVLHAIDAGAWGFENLSGIPGTVGGAVTQNIGAYGAALSQVLHSVHVFDTKENCERTIAARECELGYRGSIFKKEEGRYVILNAVFALSHTRRPNLSYKDLSVRFGERNPTLQEVREAVLEIRKAKFPDISVEGTAGSFFKNPIMSPQEAERLREAYPEIPLFSMPETEGVKVPLAWLLDNVLHLKGYAVDGARVFEKQPLVIAAARGTSSDAIKKLTSFVQEKVFEELKIKIEPEVKII